MIDTGLETNSHPNIDLSDNHLIPGLLGELPQVIHLRESHLAILNDDWQYYDTFFKPNPFNRMRRETIIVFENPQITETSVLPELQDFKSCLKPDILEQWGVMPKDVNLWIPPGLKSYNSRFSFNRIENPDRSHSYQLGVLLLATEFPEPILFPVSSTKN